MSTTTQPPDITAHLDAAERAATSLLDVLRTALNSVPDEPHLSGVRQSLVSRIALAARAGDNAHERALLAEAARPKGPMVEVVRPSYGLRNVIERVEVESITSAAIVVRSGDHFSRRSGRRTRPMMSGPTPYITAEERARVLALPRPSAPARPRATKEPRP